MKLSEEPKLTAFDYCKRISEFIPSSQVNEFLGEVSKGVVSQITSKRLEKELVRPLVVNMEDEKGGPFINCELNRDKSSYRSPWTNNFFPFLEESSRFPCNELRILEQHLNKKMKEYAKFYYGNEAISSVYLYEIGESIKKGFNISILIKNETKDAKGLTKGSYDSSIFITVKFESLKIEDEIKKLDGALNCFSEEQIKELKKSNPENQGNPESNYVLFAHFYCSFNLMYELTPKEKAGKFVGVLKKNVEKTKNPISSYLDYEFYLQNIGELVESTEKEMRDDLIYVKLGKTSYVLNSMRRGFLASDSNKTDNEILKELFEENRKNNLVDTSNTFGQILQRKSRAFSKYLGS